MLVTIPVSQHDAHLIPAFSMALRHCGPNPLHEAMVVARPSEKELADSLFANLEGLFDKVEVFLLPQDGPVGWPKGPNHFFFNVAHRLQTSPEPKPWLWMELDCTPLKAGWVSELATEYNLSKMPFMGVVCKTHAVDPEGNPVPAGKHLTGTAVYPPRLGQFSKLYTYTPRMDGPFDVICQYEFLPHVHQTKLIQHCFRTEKYARRPDGEICGEDHNNFPNGIRFDEPLSKDAVLHHGCTDGSLADLVVGTSPEKTSAEAEPVVEAAAQPTQPPKRRAKIAA